MKRLLSITVGLVMLSGCAPKYQVVQELDVNMYHMYNPKKGVEIIFTPDKLKVDGWYKMSQIDLIIPKKK